MDRTEFIDQLRMSLNGKLEPQEVTDNIRYYEDYINTQIRMGRPEAEVMEGLGSPRLIARTIADASQSLSQEYEQPVQEKEERREKHRFSWVSGILAKFFLMPKWARDLIGILVMILVLALVFTILKALLPLLIVFMIVVLFAKFFRELK